MAKRSTPATQPPPSIVPAGPDPFIQEATGAREPALQQRLIRQVADTLWLPEGLAEDERVALVHSAISMLQGIRPTDEMEGMLATQMVATHNAAMECLRRAMIPAQPPQGRDQNLRHASKLLSMYSRQIEVLNRHRGKGRQKVTVEYVNVEAGGQAIVGHIETGKSAGDGTRASNGRVGDRPSDHGEAAAEEPGQVLDGTAGAGRRRKRGKS